MVRKLVAAAAGLAAVLLVPPLVGSGGDADVGERVRGLRVLVPNSPGGGYDVTARTAAKAMEDAGLASAVEVFNLPGAGGTVGLGRLVNERGNGKLVMSMGLGVVGSVYTNKSPSSLADTTPIAKLIEEPDIVVVGKDSPYRDIAGLLTAWKADPGGVPVGGGSSPGGPDHLAPMLMAKAAGLAPRSVNYVPFDGGGELLASVLGGKVAFGVSGVGEYRDQIQAGELRVLAVTGPERIAGIDAPTLREAGLDVSFTNWRGIVAPPGISDTDRERLIAAFARLHSSPQWRDALARNGWTDAFQAGPGFGEFLAGENRRVAEVLKELGLA
ncbi:MULTISPECIES: Bug family tripartite tricarboxylate transporter substrate binding protein [Actinokineospora]|uniref:C4-dicarboxylate ABC transporter substrate-binding protein n=1 Tax=Actinokineospora fastidiosa TaxID=1816 RepID=A0A918G5Q4_9PSEU|nr:MULTISPECIES: tripartite tricarboxylate transporter substrate binding protein [Actinokineospora]UVS82482.1 Tripartite tricarboxylate transporter family receptor [Actinokineospora sp. UTMC 2448]GGS20816.1 C4-dicarboxylate ABC transporter substrate-binding protein [Actinokineospora fastidiosa]